MKQGEYRGGVWYPRVNNPNGHNKHTPKSKLKGKEKSKYEIMTPSEKAVLVFRLRKKGKELQNKAAGILSLASRIENKVIDFNEKEYTDDEIMEMIDE